MPVSAQPTPLGPRAAPRVGSRPGWLPQLLPSGPLPAGSQQRGEVVGAPCGRPLPLGPAVRPIRGHGTLAEVIVVALRHGGADPGGRPPVPRPPPVSPLPCVANRERQACRRQEGQPPWSPPLLAAPQRPGRMIHSHHHLPHHVSHCPAAVHPISLPGAPGCGAERPVAASGPGRRRPQASVSAPQP